MIPVLPNETLSFPIVLVDHFAYGKMCVYSTLGRRVFLLVYIRGCQTSGCLRNTLGGLSQQFLTQELGGLRRGCLRMHG